MSKPIQAPVPDRLPDLKEMTQARVSLGRHGSGLPTSAQLAFLLDHARAREAVWTKVDNSALRQRLEAAGLSSVSVNSMAGDRSIYVRRPDLGRMLSPQDHARLQAISRAERFDLVVVVADGLSSSAVELNAVPLIETLGPRFAELGLSVAPIVLASQARVALGDPVGEALGVKISLVLVGERPGLSAADSLGAYITFDPKPGTPDSRRNCVSNIRDGGLVIQDGARIIAALIRDMLKTGISGVSLNAAVGQLDAPRSEAGILSQE